ncbi:ATP-binding protein [Breznakiellaceae bacterium SP9]
MDSLKNSRVVIPVIYTVVILVVALFVFNGQIAKRNSHNPYFYKNLMDYPAYAKVGFTMRDITEIPNRVGRVQQAENGWKLFPARTPLRIANAHLPHIPQRHFLSPFAYKPMEFTILIPVEISPREMEFLNESTAFIPGLFLGFIGDNWEIYLNGDLIREEMHLDAQGNITTGRSWRDVYFPISKLRFVEGINLLALRVVGDPTYDGVGLYYSSPHYIGNYALIDKAHNEMLIAALCGIYFFVAIYHFMLFLSLHKERYNLYYSVFSICLLVYSLARCSLIYAFIPNSNIAISVEFFSLFMLPCTAVMFIDVLSKGKIKISTRLFTLYSLFMGVVQWVCPSLQFKEELLVIWEVSALGFIVYAFSYDIVYCFIAETRIRQKHVSLKHYILALVETPLGNVVIGTVIVFFSSVHDIIDFLFVQSGMRISHYSFFIITVSISFSLSEKFSQLYRSLDVTNAKLEEISASLESKVHERTRELAAQTERSDAASRAKSDFLARMSHEIRTPMNAIIGISELALREQTLTKKNEYIGIVSRAGVNLLSIINDILDFSKIESGEMDIIPSNYFFGTLLNDCISIISSKVDEKPVTFLTKIDGTIPAELLGDESRIRQILLNLLSNAVKYTREGFVTLSISTAAKTPPMPDSVDLRFEISDTGIGIKNEDLNKLFGQFSRIDEAANRAVEGTGLGLAISQLLCHLMGGDITVSSIYGSGSVFTVVIPQEVHNSRPFASVEEPQTKQLLLYEKVLEYIESLRFTIESLGVPCIQTSEAAAAAEILAKTNVKYVIVRSPFLSEIQEVLTALDTDSTLPVLVLLTSHDDQIGADDLQIIPLPVQPQSIARLLNGELESLNNFEPKKASVKFTAPDAHILLVDDVNTNLIVAEGLLAPYQMQIKCCTSGERSIELAREAYFDIIFMDQMMPGMDGMEAAAAIRALKVPYAMDMPIIALTANAISGMRELFLSCGFNDYLSKPIEISKLDEIMKRWIPREKQRAGSAPIVDTPPCQLTIAGLDTKHGLSMTGGGEQGYIRVLRSFVDDARERLPLLESEQAQESLRTFTIHAHTLKSAAATIGAMNVSQMAAALETAAVNGARERILQDLPPFCAALTELLSAIERSLPNKAPLSSESLFETASLFAELAFALENEDASETDRILSEAEQLPFDAQTKALLEDIFSLTMTGDFAEAVKKIDAISQRTLDA